MDTILIIAGAVLMIIGIAGNILPLLPGTPLCYFALLLQQFRTVKPFSTAFLLVWAVVVLLVILLDYIIPVYGTKKFGGTKYGIWGSAIGLVAAFWMGPLGIVLGPFLGAFIGEMIASKDSRVALKAAMGSFTGFVFGSLIKLVASGLMAWYFITAL